MASGDQEIEPLKHVSPVKSKGDSSPSLCTGGEKGLNVNVI